MKTREHKVINHPILGYFLLMIFSLLVASIISDIIDNKILGNLIPGYAITQNVMGQETNLAHMSVDFMEFIRGDLGNTGGIMTGMGIGDWITIVAGIIGIIWGLYLIRPSKRAEIVDLWKNKWSVDMEKTQ